MTNDQLLTPAEVKDIKTLLGSVADITVNTAQPDKELKQGLELVAGIKGLERTKELEYIKEGLNLASQKMTELVSALLEVVNDLHGLLISEGEDDECTENGYE